MVGAPSIQRDFAVSYLETSGALLFAPLLLSFLLEPAILLLADRRPRKWFIAGGLFGMSAGALICAWAPNAVVLTLATGLSFVATGVGVSTAQATLIDAFPDQRERIMTRWTMLAAAGDLAAPLLLAGLAALSIDWRGAYAVVGGVTAVWALAAARASFPAAAPQSEDGPEPGLWTSLRGAMQNRRLLAWLLAAWLCCLLDEIVVVFGSLYLRDHLAAGAAARGAVMIAFLVGGAVGLVATDRLLDRLSPRQLLLAAGTSCAAFYLVWMAAPSLWLSALAMAAVGAASAPLHPLAAAQAYAALPGRSGTVLAAGHLFDPLEMAVPLLLGWLADLHGAGAALLVLLAQPVGVAVIAALIRTPSGSDGERGAAALPLDIARRDG